MNSRAMRIAAVAASIAATACYDNNVTDSSPLLRLSALADSFPADSAALVRIVAHVPASAGSSNRTVTFTTNLSTFVDGGQASTQITAIDSVAVTYLRAPRYPGTARVTAKLSNAIEEVTVPFDSARPQYAVVQPAAFTVAAGPANVVSVSAILKRNVGLVTPGTPVLFEARRAGDSTLVGTFLDPLPSDANGVVSTRFTVGDTPYRKDVYIQVFTLNRRLLGQATVTVIDPPPPAS